MKNSMKAQTVCRPTMYAETAEELMTPNPVSIREEAMISEAIALLTDKGFSAAPVIDRAGRPVGVVSRADILVHDRETVQHLTPVPDYYYKSELTINSGEYLNEGFQVETGDGTLVRDIMTPVVFSVTPEASAARVIEDMVALKVHRLFVVDKTGILVGVISALDVLRHLSC
jgi:CBS domain-containing protein